MQVGAPSKVCGEAEHDAPTAAPEHVGSSWEAGGKVDHGVTGALGSSAMGALRSTALDWLGRPLCA